MEDDAIAGALDDLPLVLADGDVEAAVATPPAMRAPARNALMIVAGLLTLMLFILTILSYDAEFTL